MAVLALEMHNNLRKLVGKVKLFSSHSAMTTSIVAEAKILKALKAHLHEDDVKVSEIQVDGNFAQGKGFASKFSAVDFKAKFGDGQEKEFNWFVKTTSNSFGNWAKKIRADEKEIFVYKTLIPSFKDLISNYEAENVISLNFANCPYAEFNDSSYFIALDNLTKLGFGEPKDISFGLGIASTSLALTELAKFHALGHAHIKTSKADSFLTRDFFLHDPLDEEVSITLKDMSKDLLELALVIMSVCEEEGQGISDRLESWLETEDIFGMLSMLNGPNEKGFNTLCHGDAWFNNILFNNESGECALVDLGTVHLASPAADIAYFLFHSVSPDFRRTHNEKLLRIYHEALKRFLSALGENPEIYTFKELLKDDQVYKVHGFLWSLQNLPLVLLPTKELEFNFSTSTRENPQKFKANLRNSLTEHFHKNP